MARKLIVTREREIRLGWSLRGFPWEIELDGVKIGTVGNDETVSFDIAPDRQALAIWPAKLNREAPHTPHGEMIIPEGEADFRVSVRHSGKEFVLTVIGE